MAADDQSDSILDAFPTNLSGEEQEQRKSDTDEWLEELRLELELDDAELEVDKTLLDLLERVGEDEWKSTRLNKFILKRCREEAKCDAPTSQAALVLVYLVSRKAQRRDEQRKPSDQKEKSTGPARRPKYGARKFGRLFRERHGVKSSRALERTYRYLYDNIADLVFEFCGTTDLEEVVEHLRRDDGGGDTDSAESTVGWASRLWPSGSPFAARPEALSDEDDG